MRQIILDTETTGLEPEQGHRIIEIGCVEIVNRRLTGQTFHGYVNPEREIDEAAIDIHGLSSDFLADKPFFADIAADFIEFVREAELVIHNAPFDIGFLNMELARLGDVLGPVESYCSVLDTLALAREMHPGQRNSLDALCKRYEIDNSKRELHGALLDASLLAGVYLAMTGGQADLSLDGRTRGGTSAAQRPQHLDRANLNLTVVQATDEERAAHQKILDKIDAASDGGSVWRREQS